MKADRGTECFPDFEQDVVFRMSELLQSEHPEMLLGLTSRSLVQAHFQLVELFRVKRFTDRASQHEQHAWKNLC